MAKELALREVCNGYCSFCISQIILPKFPIPTAKYLIVTYIGMIEESALDNIRKVGLETYQDALTVLEAFGYKKFENTVYKD